jgi:hypothetical protein
MPEEQEVQAMKWLIYLLWASAGSALALLFLCMQRWTVARVHPDRAKHSKQLVIGGAILRWFLFSLLIFLALQHSFTAMFFGFAAFITTRTILLFGISRVSLFGSKETT